MENIKAHIKSDKDELENPQISAQRRRHIRGPGRTSATRNLGATDANNWNA